MDENEKELAMAIIEMVVNVGAPAAIKGIRQFTTTDNPTPQDIRNLSTILKDPKTYWGE